MGRTPSEPNAVKSIGLDPIVRSKSGRAQRAAPQVHTDFGLADCSQGWADPKSFRTLVKPIRCKPKSAWALTGLAISLIKSLRRVSEPMGWNAYRFDQTWFPSCGTCA